MKFDFGGYATRANIRCSDGRTIMRDAFKDCDGNKVPLVWQHLRDDPTNVVGYAVLENRPDGVYAYGTFNGTEKAKTAKMLVEHGDITALSIYANHLSHQGNNVTHGMIREVSLVYAGANPEAFIDNIAISHSDGSITELTDEAIIYPGDNELDHSVEFEVEIPEDSDDEVEDESEDEIEDNSDQTDEDEVDVEHADDEDSDVSDEDKAKAKTVKEVFDSLNEDQKTLFYAMVGQALEQAGKSDDAEHSDEGESEDDVEHADGYAQIKSVVSQANDKAGFKIAAAEKPLFSGTITVYKYDREGKMVDKKSSDNASDLQSFVANIFRTAEKEAAITAAMKDVRMKKKSTNQLSSITGIKKIAKKIVHEDESEDDVEHAAVRSSFTNVTRNKLKNENVKPGLAPIENYINKINTTLGFKRLYIDIVTSPNNNEYSIFLGVNPKPGSKTSGNRYFVGTNPTDALKTIKNNEDRWNLIIHTDESEDDVEHAALSRGKTFGVAAAVGKANAALAASKKKDKGSETGLSEIPKYSQKDIDMAKSLCDTLNKAIGKNGRKYFSVVTKDGIVLIKDDMNNTMYIYGSDEWKSVYNKLYNGFVKHSDIEEGGNTMKKNVFEGKETMESLSHADRVALFKEVQSYANDNNLTLRKAVEDYTESFLEHGITDIESLFPDYKSLNNPPAWIGQPEAWVNTVWNGTTKTPFARIKSAFADISKDEARAKGYIKGKKKEEEQFGLLRRTTDPQTVYKLQKLDRDDIIDITDFDVVAWLKSEMRMKLQEELSRAVLIGDGRSNSAEQKIQENHIRPILTDDVFYTLKYAVDLNGVTDTTDRANAIIDASAYAMIDYKGSGNLTAFLSPQVLADLRVAKDKNGRRLYTSISEIASALGVSNIVEVPLMKDLKRTTSTTIGDAESDKTMKTLAILVNLRDYTVGADRGGQTTMFDDFDIDYNKYTYLIETRCSGALIRPASAIVLETEDAAG